MPFRRSAHLAGAAAVLGFLLPNPTPAPAQTEAPEPSACARLMAELVDGAAAVRPEVADAFCTAMNGLAERAAAAEARATELTSRLEAIAPWVPPPGAILLVDDVRGCPDGWTDVGVREPEVFAGRVPVAAGVGPVDEVPGHRSLGGEARVRLGESELPPHEHDLPLRFARVPGADADTGRSGLVVGSSRDLLAVPSRSGRERSERAGAGAPHENRPPFVGLYWCRRD